MIFKYIYDSMFKESGHLSIVMCMFMFHVAKILFYRHFKILSHVNGLQRMEDDPGKRFYTSF